MCANCVVDWNKIEEEKKKNKAENWFIDSETQKFRGRRRISEKNVSGTREVDFIKSFLLTSNIPILKKWVVANTVYNLLTLSNLSLFLLNLLHNSYIILKRHHRVAVANHFVSLIFLLHSKHCHPLVPLIQSATNYLK